MAEGGPSGGRHRCGANWATARRGQCRRAAILGRCQPDAVLDTSGARRLGKAREDGGALSMTPTRGAEQLQAANSPWFSIVISAYNRAPLLARCLESCFAQAFSDFEVVVVDDGSTDDTIDLVNSLREARLRLIRHPQNRGLCA